MRSVVSRAHSLRSQSLWIVVLLICLMFSTIAAASGKVLVSLTREGQLETGAELELYRNEQWLDSFTLNWETGSFEVSAPPGTYRVLVRPYTEGYGERWLEVEVTEGETALKQLDLGSSVPVRIKVIADGKLVSAASVEIQGADWSYVASLSWDEETQLFQGKVAPGLYSVVIEPQDGSLEGAILKNVSLTGQQVHQVQLRAGGILQIKVTAGGKPFSEVAVTTRGSQGEQRQAKYNEELACFEVQVPKGSYNVSVVPSNPLLQEKIIIAQTDQIAFVEYPALTTFELVVSSTYGPYPWATVKVEKNGESLTTIDWDRKAGLYRGVLPEGTYDFLITPESYFSPQRLAAVNVFGETSLEVKLLKARTNTSMDLTEVMGQGELVELALHYRQIYYSSIPLSTRSAIDKQLQRLKSGTDDGAEMINSTSSLAVMIGAKGMAREIAVTLGAAAVIASPENALVINNFGALLRLLSRTEDAVRVLNFGRIVAPQSPLILTNLANSLFELGDDETAEELYIQAIREEAMFSQAHQGLATIYLMRGNLNKAIEHLFKAAGQSYAPVMRQQLQKAQAGGGSISDSYLPKVPAAEPGVFDKLEIPRLPNWTTRDALSAGAKDIGIWANDVMEKGLARPLSMAQNMQPAPWVEKAYGGVYSQAVFEIECYGYFLSDRVGKIYDEYQVALESIQAAWSKELKQIEYIQISKIEAAGVANIRAQDAADQFAGKERALAADRFFLAWKPLYEKTYEEIARLTEEYWLYTESPASRIYDRDVAVFVNEIRSTAVYSSFLPAAMELPAKVLIFELAGMGPILRPEGELPSPDPPKPMESTKVPPPKKNDCPFKGGSILGADFGFAGLEVGCETIEIKLGSLIEGGMTYNFKHKYVSSIYAGVGVSAKIAGVGAGATAGLRATFGPTGEFLGIGSEAGIDGSMGPFSASATDGDGMVVGLGPVSTAAANF